MASLNNEKAEVKAILEINSSVQTSPETLSPNQSNNNRSLNHTTKRDSSSSYMKQRSTENQRSESHSNAKAKVFQTNKIAYQSPYKIIVEFFKKLIFAYI